MQYNHKHEKAKAYAEQALARIFAEKLPANPTIFTLWYQYYSQHNAELVRAIDLMVDAKYPITEERCYELYRRLLSEEYRSEDVLTKAEDLVSESVTNMNVAASAVKQKTDDYSLEIQRSVSDIDTANSTEVVREVAQTVLVKAKRMVAENKELETQLVQSAQVMQQLRDEMELVRREAMVDSLTGIANRKLFDDEILRMVIEAHNENKPLSLLMLDIDHFKTFNDTYGHQVGDQVLKLVARTLKDGVKGRDLPARYGGEEFAVLLPETLASAADIVANALRKTVSEKEIINRTTGERLGRITLSIGAAQLMRNEKPSSLIERADYALYIAKHQGRNRVVVDDTHLRKKS